MTTSPKCRVIRTSLNIDRMTKSSPCSLSSPGLSVRLIARTPEAQAALDKEWFKLVKAKAWDELSVREWSDVARQARDANVKAHMGRIFEICVEKGSELPKGDPNRKYKGRSVFQRNQVRDEHYDYAIFSELSSSPATMQAGKFADSFGLFAGSTVMQADA